MSVKLNTRQVGDVSVVDVAGRITLGEGSSALRDLLREMVGKGQKKILLNLGEVSYIDSSGIGELVSGFTTVTNSGGELKLLNLNKRVKDLLQITKLYTVFDVHEDEAGAITTVTFEDRDGMTLLRFHEIYPSREALEEALQGSAAGLPEQLDQLDAMLPDIGT